MKRLLHPLIFIFSCLLTGVGYCQPSDAVYANGQTNDGTFPSALGVPTGSYAVTNAGNAVASGGSGLTKPDNAGAKLTASSTAGVATAWLQMSFPGDVTGGNKTVYIKVAPGAIGLLGGGVTLQAYSTVTGTGSSVTLASATPSTYYTADGNVYLAIKPTATFRSVRVFLSSPVALGTSSIDVFFAFYGPSQISDTNPFPSVIGDCGSPNVSTTQYTDFVTLGSTTIANPGNAIDDNLSTVSAFNTGGLVVAGHMLQTFYFNGNANPADAVRIIFSKGTSLVNVNVAPNITLQARNSVTGATSTSQPLSVLLDADLLGLLTNTSNSITVYYAPKDASGNPFIFDRVTIDFALTANIALNGNGLNINDIRRVPDVPTVIPTVTACTNVGKINLNASFSSQEGLTSFTYNWYNAIRSGSLLSALLGKTPQVTGLTTVGQTSYYVDITKSGCSVPSGRSKVTVNTVLPPVAPAVALTP